MTMTLSEQLKSAASTAVFLENFLDGLEEIREEAQACKYSVTLFPHILEAFRRMEAQLTHAKLTADWIYEQNEDFRREGVVRLVAERSAQASAESDDADRCADLVDRFKAELEDMDIGTDSRVVVRVAVIEDGGEEYTF